MLKQLGLKGVTEIGSCRLWDFFFGRVLGDLELESGSCSLRVLKFARVAVCGSHGGWKV